MYDLSWPCTSLPFLLLMQGARACFLTVAVGYAVRKGVLNGCLLMRIVTSMCHQKVGSVEVSYHLVADLVKLTLCALVFCLLRKQLGEGR